MSQMKKDDAIWEDCGCHLSMAKRTFIVDTSIIIPHICTFGKDEQVKHYIFDQAAFRAITKAHQGSPLNMWVQERLRDCRLFVAKPPKRLLLPLVPWCNNEPPIDWTLPPRWQLWEPKDKMLNFNEDNPVEEYDKHMSLFFLYINLRDPVKQEEMKENVEGWMMACGEDTCLIKGKHPSKMDRCFVTSNHEFFTYLWTAKDKMNSFLRDLKIHGQMRHICRLVDIIVDSRVCFGACGKNYPLTKVKWK